MKRVVLIGAVLIMMAAAFWAGRVTVRPPAISTEAPNQVVLTRVAERTVGRTLQFSTTAAQPLAPAGVNALSGIVTAVGKGGVIDNGDTLYAVNNVPVRAVRSSMPFYRPISAGVEGADVKALRDLLVELGFAEASGETFTDSAREALKQWQRQLGIPQTGMAQTGELLAIQTLPATVSLDTKALRPGAKLVGDESVVMVPSGPPSFTMVLTREQAALVPSAATIEVPWQQVTWQAKIAGSEVNQEGYTVLRLTAPSGGPVCGRQCDSVVGGETKQLMSRVHVVPPVTGPAVPLSAMTTDASGTASVLVVSGDERVRRDVRVRGAQDGVAVVTGLRPGELVQVFGETPGVGTPSAQPTARET